ncbi:MAG: hypothetical protein SVM86_06510, partial [Candidatus Cloacimonadota bacterium]|nr:hypothetical protein [Candidatus Cloacimonadota bacterium]
MKYNQDGEIESDIQTNIAENREILKPFIFEYQDSEYIIITFRRDEWENSSATVFLDTEIYTFDELNMIESHSLDTGYWDDSYTNHLKNISTIKKIFINGQQNFLIGCKMLEGYPIAYSSQITYDLLRFVYYNNELELSEIIENSGYKIYNLPENNEIATIDIYKDAYAENGGLNYHEEKEYRLKKISFQSSTQVNEIFSVSGNYSYAWGAGTLFYTYFDMPSNFKILNL